jgi:hypothetical protein
MTLDERVVSGLRDLPTSDKRVIADLVDFLRARRRTGKRRAAGADEDQAWQALSVKALFRDADHPDEVDYSLADAHPETPR